MICAAKQIRRVDNNTVTPTWLKYHSSTCASSILIRSKKTWQNSTLKLQLQVFILTQNSTKLIPLVIKRRVNLQWLSFSDWAWTEWESETNHHHTPLLGPVLSARWRSWADCWPRSATSHLKAQQEQTKGGVGRDGIRFTLNFYSYQFTLKLTSTVFIKYSCLLSSIENITLKYTFQSQGRVCVFLPNSVKGASKNKQNPEKNWTCAVFMIKQLILWPARSA